MTHVRMPFSVIALLALAAAFQGCGGNGGQNEDADVDSQEDAQDALEGIDVVTDEGRDAPGDEVIDPVGEDAAEDARAQDVEEEPECPPVSGTPSAEIALLSAYHMENTGWNPQDFTADLPPGPWGRVVYSFETVSTGDPYDRLVSGALIAGEERVEIDRGATDYGYSVSWERDVTDYVNFMARATGYSLLITTWPLSAGYGWDVDATLRFYEGGCPDVPDAVIPVFALETIEPPADCLTGGQRATQQKDVEFPAYSRARFDLFATGHAQGGVGCDEFCRKNVFITVDGSDVATAVPWRTNCTNNHGTHYDRSGWCPNSSVQDGTGYFHLDVPTDIGAGTHTVGVEIENACKYWKIGLALLTWD